MERESTILKAVTACYEKAMVFVRNNIVLNFSRMDCLVKATRRSDNKYYREKPLSNPSHITIMVDTNSDVRLLLRIKPDLLETMKKKSQLGDFGCIKRHGLPYRDGLKGTEKGALGEFGPRKVRP